MVHARLELLFVRFKERKFGRGLKCLLCFVENCRDIAARGCSSVASGKLVWVESEEAWCGCYDILVCDGRGSWVMVLCEKFAKCEEKAESTVGFFKYL